MVAVDNKIIIMTKLLETKSGKEFLQLTKQEIDEIKRDISAEVARLVTLDAAAQMQTLMDLRFGILRNTLLHLACEFSNEVDVATILQLAGGKVEIINAKNADFFTAIHFVAITGNENIAKLLFNAKINPNVPASQKRRSWMPIHYAAKYNRVKVMELLIANGVDKETVTGFGLTPFVIASEFGRIDMLKFLLGAGSNKNARTSEDNYCMNALHYAAVGNFIEVAKFLLKSGVERNVETTSGFSALDFAAKSDNYEMVKLLAEWGAGDLELAYKAAKEDGVEKSLELLKQYIDAKKKVFDGKWIVQNESMIAKILTQATLENVGEKKITVSDVEFNPLGLVSLKQTSGILFMKKTKTFIEFAFEKTVSELPLALEKFKIS
jgi:hypothetical protein